MDNYNCTCIYHDETIDSSYHVLNLLSRVLIVYCFIITLFIIWMMRYTSILQNNYLNVQRRYQDYLQLSNSSNENTPNPSLSPTEYTFSTTTVIIEPDDSLHLGSNENIGTERTEE